MNKKDLKIADINFKNGYFEAAEKIYLEKLSGCH
jgi:hypothetical protein